MATKNRSSGDDSFVRQLHQICSLCNQPIVPGGPSYKYEKVVGLHQACLKDDVGEAVVASYAHEKLLAAFSICFTSYPQERRLVLNLFEDYTHGASVIDCLECMDQAIILAQGCRFDSGPVLVQKLRKIKEEIEGLAASLEVTQKLPL